MPMDLSKQKTLDVDPKAIQKTSFKINLDQLGNTAIFLIIEKSKETIFDFSQGTVKLL